MSGPAKYKPGQKTIWGIVFPAIGVYRGSRYCAHDYQKLLRNNGFKVSMSGKGNCYENSAVESFFKSLKAELIWRRSWQTRREVKVRLFEYIRALCGHSIQDSHDCGFVVPSAYGKFWGSLMGKPLPMELR